MSDWSPATCIRCTVGCTHLQQESDIGDGFGSIRRDAVRLPSHYPKTNDYAIPADPQSTDPNRKQCAARSVANGATVAVAGGEAA